MNTEEIIKTQMETIALMQKTIENIQKTLNGVIGDLDYLQESINPDIVKAVRELQEQVAKDRGEPIRFLFTRVI